MRNPIRSARPVRSAAIAAAAAALLAGAGCGRSGAGAASPGGAPAVPAATIRPGDVPAIKTELKARIGRPVLLNFWASWCGPCVEELPDLGRFAREQGATGADFVGVSLDAWVSGDGPETTGKVRQTLADAGVGYLNLIYEGDQDPLAAEFRMPAGIPYSILYDARGKRARAWAGMIEIDELKEILAGMAKPATAPGAPEAASASGPREPERTGS